MNIAQKLKKIQKYSGLTQQELAAKLEVSFVTVNSWINQHSNPRIKKQEKIDRLYRYYVSGEGGEPVSHLDSLLQQVVQLQNQFGSITDQLAKRPDLLDQLVLEITYHTNRIEGSTFTIQETAQVLLHDQSVANKTMREHLEVTNHELVLRNILQNNDVRLGELQMLKWHEQLMQGVLDNAGEYRDHPVRIVGSYVPTSNHQSVARHINEWLTEYAQTKLTVEHIAIAHSQFEQIHPFTDGNGRMGRLIMIHQCIQNNLPPIIIPDERKSIYYRALQRSQLENDHLPLTIFTLESIIETYQLFSNVFEK